MYSNFNNFFPVSVLQFSEFDTEKNFDTVQILGGGRTDDTAVNMASLSGTLDLSSQTFVSASNFMVIKFKTDGSVEKRGLRSSWRTEAQSCGGDLIATLPEAELKVSQCFLIWGCMGTIWGSWGILWTP